jgi:hypothetical protein
MVWYDKHLGTYLQMYAAMEIPHNPLFFPAAYSIEHMRKTQRTM